MKKVTVLMCALVFGAIVASAQSPGDRRVVSDIFRGSFSTKTEKIQVTILDQAIKQEQQKNQNAVEVSQELLDTTASLPLVLVNAVADSKLDVHVAKRIAVLHQDVVKALKNLKKFSNPNWTSANENDKQASFAAQTALFRFEDLASAVGDISDESTRQSVKKALNHKYLVFDSWLNLKAASKIVNAAGLTAGHGMTSAGLQDDGFYDSL